MIYQVPTAILPLRELKGFAKNMMPSWSGSHFHLEEFIRRLETVLRFPFEVPNKKAYMMKDLEDLHY